MKHRFESRRLSLWLIFQWKIESLAFKPIMLHLQCSWCHVLTLRPLDSPLVTRVTGHVTQRTLNSLLRAYRRSLLWSARKREAWHKKSSTPPFFILKLKQKTNFKLKKVSCWWFLCHANSILIEFSEWFVLITAGLINIVIIARFLSCLLGAHQSQY